MKILPLQSALLLFSVLYSISLQFNAQSQINGTWYVNGRADLPCNINQEGLGSNLGVLMGKRFV